MSKFERIALIGGGLAGLASAIQLARTGFHVRLIEKNEYPFHRVCGEYISNESLPFLRSLGIDPFEHGAVPIKKLEVSSPAGRLLKKELDLGGFGISRYRLDKLLYDKALEEGAEVITGLKVVDLKKDVSSYRIDCTGGKTYEADLVLGSFGKRSNLDQSLNRAFFYKRSPYVGVKYHLHYDQDPELIALHNFKSGYAGISRIEDNTFCFCYLSKLSNLKTHKTIEAMEQAVLCRNPYLHKIFSEASFIFDKPVVITGVSFHEKTQVEHGIFMTGDAAGTISPLCGNGMSMALHASKIVAALLIKASANTMSLKSLEEEYAAHWRTAFSKRVWLGRQVQKLFGNPFLTDLSLAVLEKTPKISGLLIKQTHGEVF